MKPDPDPGPQLGVADEIIPVDGSVVDTHIVESSGEPRPPDTTFSTITVAVKGCVLVIVKLFTILHVSCPPAAISPVAENEPIPICVQSPENDGDGPVISV